MKNGIYITRLTLFLFIIPLGLFVLSVIFEPLKVLNINLFVFTGLMLDLVLIIVIFLDGFLSPDYKKKIKIEIIEKKIFRINSFNRIKIMVVNNNSLSVSLHYLLDLDYSFDREYSRDLLTIGPMQEKIFDLSIFAKRRGEYKSELFYIKGQSLFKLLYFYNKYKHDAIFEVVPFIGGVNDNFKIIQKKIKKFEGFQKHNVIGDGHDFEMLRDYIKGDEFGKIDWKATSRQRKPITRVYRLENILEVAVMIDCGRLLSTEVKGMSLLDYAVNSALVLAYSCLRGHDRVSLTCFGADIIKYIPPIKNKKDVKKINFILTNVDYQYVESNYQTAFGFIKQNLPKRSLIIMMTDIIDDSNIKIYHKYLSVLKKKHIVLLILIRDKNLFNIGESLLSDRISVFTKAASADLILRRNKMIHDLKKLGIDILDLYPEEITAKVINKYVEIKSKN